MEDGSDGNDGGRLRVGAAIMAADRDSDSALEFSTRPKRPDKPNNKIIIMIFMCRFK